MSENENFQDELSIGINPRQERLQNQHHYFYIFPVKNIQPQLSSYNSFEIHTNTQDLRYGRGWGWLPSEYKILGLLKLLFEATNNSLKLIEMQHHSSPKMNEKLRTISESSEFFTKRY